MAATIAPAAITRIDRNNPPLVDRLFLYRPWVHTIHAPRLAIEWMRGVRFRRVEPRRA